MHYYPEHAHDFMVCIEQGNYLAALEIGKIYAVLPDPDAVMMQMVRIIDELGDECLYPHGYFMPIDLPQPLQAALRNVA